VPSPDPVEDALARATLLQQASKAGLAKLEAMEIQDDHGVADLIRQRVDQRNFAAWERLSTVADQEAPSELYSRTRLEMIEAERARVLEIRNSGTVASEVISDVLAMLDVEESMLEVAQQQRAHLVAETTMRSRRTGESCAHLEAHPVVVTDATECPTCIEEGTVWVSLRQCLSCGNIGCCDSSPRQHASAHFQQTGHPVIQSAEPGEDWRWCFVDHTTA
jgi:CPA1 family monovalent cation:H+ antiporter